MDSPEFTAMRPTNVRISPDRAVARAAPTTTAREANGVVWPPATLAEMRSDEREVLERAVHRVTEQAVASARLASLDQRFEWRSNRERT
jgi:hypothetical protein